MKIIGKSVCRNTPHMDENRIWVKGVRIILEFSIEADFLWIVSLNYFPFNKETFTN